MKTTTFNYFIRRNSDGKFWRESDYREGVGFKHVGESNWTHEKRGWMDGALSFTIEGAEKKKRELQNLSEECHIVNRHNL